MLTQDEPKGIRQLVYDWDMRLIMNDERLQTIEQVKQFLEGSEALEFGGVSIEERYHWIETVLVRFRYYWLKRAEKGVIRRYIEKVSGYSGAQVSRLIGEYNRILTIEDVLKGKQPAMPMPAPYPKAGRIAEGRQAELWD